jgi:hypothetical protein
MKTIKNVFGIALLICAILVGCKENEPVKIPTGEIPDMVFRDYLLRNFDRDLDGFISTEEAKMVKEMNLNNNESVTSLKGIEYFTSLENLYLRGHHRLEELDLSNNPELRILDCCETYVLNLNLAQNAKLKELYCANINCNTLSLNNCTELEVLDCSGNLLTTIDFSNSKLLKFINLSNNFYLYLQSVNLNEFKHLEEFYCENVIAEIRELSVSNIPLKRFNCPPLNGNINISNLPDLESLSIKNASNESNITLDLTKSTKLKSLQCVHLNCNVDLSNCTDLEVFSWHNPWLAEHTVDISNNKALKTIQFFTYTGKIPSFKNNTSLTNLWLYAKDKEHYDFSSNTLLERL